MCAGGGGGGGNPVTQIVETVQENVIDPVVDTVQEKVIDPVVETYEGSDLQTLVETPGEAVQTALGISDEDVEAVSDAVSVDVGNISTGLEFSVPTIGTPEFAASNMDWGAFAPTTPFVNPFADLPDLKIIPEDLTSPLTDLSTGIHKKIDLISDTTPDLIIDTSGLENLTEGIATGISDTTKVAGETLGGITSDILQGDLGTVMTDATETIGDFLTNPLGTTQEILDHNLGDSGLKGAIDQTVEFVQNPSKVINKAKDRLDDFIEGTKEEVTGTVEDYKEVVTDIGDTAEEIGQAATETYQTGMETVTQLGENAATQVTEAQEDLLNALVEAGLLTRRPPEEEGVGNAQAIMAGDPRMLSLMARRNRARKRGKAQLRKGGGLYIPVGTGLQVPA